MAATLCGAKATALTAALVDAEAGVDAAMGAARAAHAVLRDRFADLTSNLSSRILDAGFDELVAEVERVNQLMAAGGI